ncbi:hypothetical protein K1719_028798 [Acacia pycnantha]|nr:hypothetical protein K1719_028798 [Acacia pycnantha]
MEGILPDGASINRPLGFNDGVRIPKLEEEYDENDRRQVTLNSKAIIMLQSAQSQKEYFRICTLLFAKAMWDALEIAHEGTTGIKENRVNTLITEYDLLRKLKFRNGLDEINNKNKGIDLMIVKEDKESDDDKDNDEEVGLMRRLWHRPSTK